jgi:hypothetical protein
MSQVRGASSGRQHPRAREKGGAPETIIAHDLTHVLTGYSTALESEACVTSFQAGYRREGAFAGLLFVLRALAHADFAGVQACSSTAPRRVSCPGVAFEARR